MQTIARPADDGYRADVVVSCAEEVAAGDGRYLRQPRVVVEVRSPQSNAGISWEAKLLEYWSTPSIEQVVIIESDSRAVASYCRASVGGWQPPVTTVDNGTLRFPALELVLTLHEVYHRSSLQQ